MLISFLSSLHVLKGKLNEDPGLSGFYMGRVNSANVWVFVAVAIGVETSGHGLLTV